MSHRDLHPGNLLRTEQGRVVVLDLGLARLMGPRETGTSEASQLSSFLTPEGTVLLGNAEYVAPEIVTGLDDADIRADLYSLGCVLFYLLAGRPPFQAERVLEVLSQQMTMPVPNIRAIRNEVPVSLAQILEKLLAKNPNNRFATPNELIQALKQVPED
jgi:serine/threonine protein kinase